LDQLSHWEENEHDIVLFLHDPDERTWELVDEHKHRFLRVYTMTANIDFRSNQVQCDAAVQLCSGAAACAQCGLGGARGRRRRVHGDISTL